MAKNKGELKGISLVLHIPFLFFYFIKKQSFFNPSSFIEKIF